MELRVNAHVELDWDWSEGLLLKTFGAHGKCYIFHPAIKMAAKRQILPDYSDAAKKGYYQLGQRCDKPEQKHKFGRLFLTVNQLFNEQQVINSLN